MNDQLHSPIPAGWSWEYSWLNLSLADIITAVLMVLVFIIAIVLPFPGGGEK
jgi:hypothetical protein